MEATAREECRKRARRDVVDGEERTEVKAAIMDVGTEKRDAPSEGETSENGENFFFANLKISALCVSVCVCLVSRAALAVVLGRGSSMFPSFEKHCRARRRHGGHVMMVSLASRVYFLL